MVSAKLSEPTHPVLRAMALAPRGEPFTPEQEAELAQDMDDLRAGRARFVKHADVPRALEEMRQHQAG